MSMDLNLLPMFATVAETRNFQAAADRLGLTRSAVSQGIKRLEQSCGVQLVHRTTRAVALTEAGERLHLSLNQPLDAIAGALERAAGDLTPRGHIKIAATSIAERFLSGPFVAEFARLHPNITIDVTVTDEEFDIVASGFDAGVRLGEVIEKDMIAVPLTGDQREMVVATPEYLDRFGRPTQPEDLLHHRCIGWRPQHRGEPYNWEFARNGKPFDIAVQPQITSNDLRFLLRAALAGAGLTFATEETFRTYIRRGQLVPVLEKFLPPFPGFHLFFPHRTDLSPKMRALVDHARAQRRNGTADSSGAP
ncbi:LysR family transcriptional regulator [Marinibacterium sp. SX1]|uniref:LysR family transcriptional regulator n=1 Tax=Marinibacterium sp. SX1 TaxID=3388424 RepID=UPI003D17F110